LHLHCVTWPGVVSTACLGLGIYCLSVHGDNAQGMAALSLSLSLALLANSLSLSLSLPICLANQLQPDTARYSQIQPDTARYSQIQQLQPATVRLAAGCSCGKLGGLCCCLALKAAAAPAGRGGGSKGEGGERERAASASLLDAASRKRWAAVCGFLAACRPSSAWPSCCGSCSQLAVVAAELHCWGQGQAVPLLSATAAVALSAARGWIVSKEGWVAAAAAAASSSLPP